VDHEVYNEFATAL